MARIGLHAMTWGVHFNHLFASGVLACVMAIFLPLFFNDMGTAAFRDKAMS